MMSSGRPDVSECEIVFLSAKRTAFGGFGGSLRGFFPTDLAVASGRAALEEGGLNANDLDHVICPASPLKRLVTVGHYDRKSGVGFCDYSRKDPGEIGF